jgi:hypothetical protein
VFFQVVYKRTQKLRKEAGPDGVSVIPATTTKEAEIGGSLLSDRLGKQDSVTLSQNTSWT